MVCEPASSPRNFWSTKNRVAWFVLQKDFSKRTSIKSVLLPAKFPSGLRRPFRLAVHPVSVNVLWDGFAVQVAFLSLRQLICCRSGGRSRYASDSRCKAVRGCRIAVLVDFLIAYLPFVMESAHSPSFHSACHWLHLGGEGLSAD